jgi:ribosomal protein S30
VHGSLARAGKVKGQMPKVEKQDKKKGVKGRAKMRCGAARLSCLSNRCCAECPIARHREARGSSYLSVGRWLALGCKERARGLSGWAAGGLGDTREHAAGRRGPLQFRLISRSVSLC